MKKKQYYWQIIIFIAIILIALFYFLFFFPCFGCGSIPPSKEELCTNSGGTVTIQSCCQSVDDFPNTCLIGACGCSPTNSHNVKICDCGEGKCWKETEGCITTP